MRVHLLISILILSVSGFFSNNIEKKRHQSVSSAGINHVADTQKEAEFSIVPFGSGGQLKMIYDRRQRPQAVFINNKVYMVYNGGASVDANNSEKTYPFVLSFDLKSELLSPPIKLGEKASGDHHYCPIIWADNMNFFHVLYGCHSTPGTHLISNGSMDIGVARKDWTITNQIRHSLSYPSVHNIYDNKKLIYFRTGEHRSSWTYLISADDGKSWSGPENDVVDLNMGGETHAENNKPGMEEWSSYQTCLPSEDGKFLHVAFCYYDDNKKSIPDKFYNPRYQTKKNLNFKYNLYYIKINLQTNEVFNFEEETVKTPVDLDRANAKCKIWDTDWRGSGIPPEIIIDENGNPAFLHVLSEDTPDEFNYYYVRFVNNRWEQTLIAPSNHYWNNGYIYTDKKGILHAYLISGEKELVDHKEQKKRMDDYGGGNIEEWISGDKGNTWEKKGTIISGSGKYAGWKFNNIQPVKDAKGKIEDGMMLFYGWKDGDLRDAKAFLLYRK